jgi:hypothetical protein
MALVGTFATELKTCVMKLRRIGDTDGETIEIQHRATVPALGEVIEVSVGEAIVRARVTHISAPAANVPGEFTIGADELSSGYLWETLIALGEVRRWRTAAERAGSSEAEEPSFGARGDTKVGATMPRSCSTSSRTAEARLIRCQTLREAGAQSRLAGVSLSRERRTPPACHRLQADVRGRVGTALAAFRCEDRERVAQPHTTTRAGIPLGSGEWAGATYGDSYYLRGAPHEMQENGLPLSPDRARNTRWR